LAGKVFPLPEGKFKLVYLSEYSANPVQTGNSPMTLAPGKMAQVGLVLSEGSTMRVAGGARANLSNNVNWAVEPCKRTDTYRRVDRLRTFDYRADCLLVNHETGFLRNPQGFWLEVRERLIREGISLPIPLVLNATVTRIEHSQYMAVSYWVNPLAYGFVDDNAASWTTSTWHKSRIDQDAEKAAFVAAFATWAERLMPAVDEGFRGKPVLGDLRRLPSLELPRKKN
jgi:hypothetical protein